MNRDCGVAAALTFVLAYLVFVGPASATPVSMSFDRGRVSIGGLFQDKDVLPATSTFPSDDLPLPQRTDIQLLGDATGDSLTIPDSLNSGLQFPYMHLMHPVEPDLKVPFTIRLDPPGLKGHWNPATGEITELSGKLDVIVVTGQGRTFPLPDSLTDLATPPLGEFARCRIKDVPVSFSTGGTRGYIHFKGQPYADGLDGDGAIATFWDDLPDPVPENGTAEEDASCGDLGHLIHYEGGIWLGHGVAEPVTVPDPPPSCETDYLLCPTDKPTPTVAIRKLKLTPKNRTVRAGKRTWIKVWVRNAGTAPAKKLAVKLRSSNRRVRIRRQIRLTVPAKSWRSRIVKVRIPAKARGKARITARTVGRSARMKLRIKPRMRHRPGNYHQLGTSSRSPGKESAGKRSR